MVLTEFGLLLTLPRKIKAIQNPKYVRDAIGKLIKSGNLQGLKPPVNNVI